MRVSACAALLALAVPQAEAAACAAGAKAFPSSHKDKGKVNYANLFDITYRDTYKIVQYSPTLSKYNSGSHPDDTMKGKSIPPLILYQCGTTKPSFGDAGVDSSDTRFFEIPVQKATVGWGGPLAFFELLGVTEYIELLDMSFIGSECMQLLEHCEAGIHMKASNANWSSTAAATDVVFTDSFGTGWAGKEKDIPFQISLDPGSLQRAEWIRFMAAFFNEEVRANEIFSKIEKDYMALKAMAAKLSAWEGSEWKGKVPQVMFVTKSWDGSFQVNTAHYKRDFVQDAGGRLVPLPATPPKDCSFKDNTDGSKTLVCQPPNGTSSFKTFLKEADVIIDESYIPKHDGSKTDFEGTYGVTKADVPALARDPPNIFRMDGTISDTEGAEGNVGNLWFETMPSQPQQLLAGIMEALWSKDFQSPCGKKYVRRALASEKQTVLKHSDCAHFDAGGSHNCKAMHDSFKEVPECSKSATSSVPTVAPEVSAASGVRATFFTLAAMLASLI